MEQEKPQSGLRSWWQAAVRSLEELVYSPYTLRQHERSRRTDALMRRGHATSAELFAADFGTDHPEGLDVDAYPRHDNRIFNFTDLPEYLNGDSIQRQKILRHSVGQYNFDDEKISMHPDYYTSRFFWSHIDYRQASTLAHEHIHRLQDFERKIGWSSTYEGMRTQFIKEPVRGGGVQGGVKRLYQKFCQAVTERGHKRRHGGATDLRVGDYHCREMEMQSRLHEILVSGYASWQRMPQNKIELWAALHNLGLNAPPTVMETLKNTPKGVSALKTFACEWELRSDVYNKVTDLNTVGDYMVFNGRREAAWENLYPYLYGNLIEHYGDSQGRARMDLGSTPRVPLTILTMLAAREEPDRDRLAELTRAVPVDRANELVNALIYRYPPEDVHYGDAMAVLDGLLERPDVRQALVRQDKWDIRQGVNGRPCMIGAIMSGREDFIARLAPIGIDPFLSCHRVDLTSDGSWNMGALVQMPDLLKGVREHIEKENKKPPRRLSDAFNDASWRDEQRQALANYERGLRAFAAHCPGMDQPREVTMPWGEKSVRKPAEFFADYMPASPAAGAGQAPASTAPLASPGADIPDCLRRPIALSH